MKNILVRLPVMLAVALTEIAKLERRSINAQIVKALEEWIASRKAQ